MQLSYQRLMNEWLQFKERKPREFYLLTFVLLALTYYLFILLPLSLWTQHLQNDIATKQAQVSWMVKASQEIVRLRSTTAKSTAKISSETPFTYLNRSITEQGWSTIVTDVRQVDQKRIQLNFNAIAFTELMSWLKTISTERGLYVVDAAMSRVKPGVVQANLTLEVH